VVEVIHARAYRLQEINGATFPNAWNIEKLRKFYPYPFLFYFFTLFSLSLSSGMSSTMGR
jgi:hypothetical protein